MTALSQSRRTIGARDGRTGFEVSALGFGAGTIAGWGDFSPTGTWADASPSDGDGLGAVDTAFAGGVSFYDTAPWYGRGRSERRLGVALSNLPREAYHLQTKIGRFIVPGQPTDNDSSGQPIADYQGRDTLEHGQPFGVVHDYTYDAIMRQHADSLQRLGVSHVDSLVIHDLVRSTLESPLAAAYWLHRRCTWLAPCRRTIALH